MQDARIDAARPDATAAVCMLGTLNADFENGVPDWALVWKGPSPGADAASLVENGLLKTVPAEVSEPAWAGIRSPSVAFQQRRNVVEIIQMVNTGVPAVAFFGVDSPNGAGSPSLRINQRQGELHFAVDDGVSYSDTSIPYDPVDHRYWQLREEGNTFYFETSIDGLSFTTRRTLPTPAFVSSVWVVIGAGSNELAVAPGEAHFDNMLDCGL